MRRTMIKFRASVLEKEEEKRKFRARSLRQAGVMEQEGPHEMSRVMEHIAASSLREYTKLHPPRQIQFYSDGGLFAKQGSDLQIQRCV
jgi:hypothetical protein